MTYEQLWAQYASAALTGLSSSPDGAPAGNIRCAAKYADDMLKEHMKRFPEEQQESASWEQQEGFEWMTVSGRKIPSWPNAQEAKQPDADGWVKWDGGECPVSKGVLVDIAIRGGEVCKEVDAGKLQWLHADGSSLDIIAYRLIR